MADSDMCISKYFLIKVEERKKNEYCDLFKRIGKSD